MSLNKNLIAAAVCGALAVSSVAEAKKKDDDSVHSWGPWASMATPAAGGNYGAGFGSGGGTPGYTPDRTVEAQEGCASGAACSYATYRRLNDRLGYIPADLEFHNSGEEIAYWDLISYAFTIDDSDGNPLYPVLDTTSNDGWDFAYAKIVYPGVQMGGWHVDWCGPNCSSGSFATGVTTSAEQMAAGAVSGTYFGTNGHTNLPVVIDVNFGDATWSGSWNGGRDGNVGVQIDASGAKFVQGQVGFTASGVINGSNITSTQVGAVDGTVTGGVNGSFFGTSAESVAGISDITKTRVDVYEDARNAEVFAATRGVQKIAPPGLN